MKTKLLYVVVSSAKDTFLEQAYLSMTSAKYYNPECHIAMLTDEYTRQSLDENRKKILAIVDELVVVPTDGMDTPKKRSRYIKCSARQHISGDFLYIDTDTLIARAVDDIDNLNVSVGAIPDMHSLLKDCTSLQGNLSKCEQIGFKPDTEKPYYNGGVLYVKDDDCARNFYQTWLEEWLKGLEKGIDFDQPALAKADSLLGYVIKPIDDRWNVQYVNGVHYLGSAYIFHYLVSNKKPHFWNGYVLKNDEAFQLLKENYDHVNDDFYQKLIKYPVSGIDTNAVIVGGEDAQLVYTALYDKLRKLFLKKKSFQRVEKILDRIQRVRGKYYSFRAKRKKS